MITVGIELIKIEENGKEWKRRERLHHLMMQSFAVIINEMMRFR